MITPQELKQRLKGPIPLVVTPFRSDYSVDFEGLRRHVNFLLASGMKVINPLGTSGEFASLTLEEHKAVMKAVVEEANGQATVLVGASHCGTHVAIDLVRYAENIGADGVLVRPPFYWCDEEGIFLHFESLSQSSDIGIVLYNCTQPPTSYVTLPLLERLCQLKNVVAMKEAGPGGMDFYYHALIKAGHQLSILGGGPLRYFLFGSLFGSPGYIDILGTFAPNWSLRFYSHLLRGELDQAKSIVLEYETPFLELASSIGGAAATLRTMKAALNLLGLPGGLPRPPLRPFPEEKLPQLNGLLMRLGLL
jgi:4-hydroxy-tetrahydrodipicolinate synthase